MAQHHYLDMEHLETEEPQEPRAKQMTPEGGLSSGTSVIGLVAFALAVAVVTVSLLGNTNQPGSVAAYFLNGNTVSLGRHSLDLSRPIYLRGSMPVCPDADALANYSPSNPAGCTLTQSTEPASLVAILTDGMKQPSFQMQLGQGPNALRGWVDYSNLTN